MDNTKTFIEAPELDFQYSLKLRTHSKFALGDCLFTYYKYKMKLSDEGDPFDQFVIEVQGNYNKREADKKIKEAVNFLIYLTDVPFEITVKNRKLKDLWKMNIRKVFMKRKKVII